MTDARFQPGDRVRIEDRDPPVHNRVPRYVRGRIGVIERVCGAFGQPELLAYGGADAHSTSEEERDCEDFTYLWDQHSFDPINNHATNYIHFEFDDGSELRRAFRYDWRLWSVPETRDVLAEAGFRHNEVYWEGTDHKTGEGNSIFSLKQKALDDPAWVAYIAAFP